MHDSDPATILKIVADLARQRFGWTGAITSETRLVEDLELDSLKALEMIIEIENRFEITIDESSEGEIITVGDLARVIDRAVVGQRELDR
jgi:acyl carrier protein